MQNKQSHNLYIVHSLLPLNHTSCVLQAGLDSLAAVELRNAVASKFGVQLPATVTFDYPTVAALAAFVAGLVAVSAAEAEPDTASVSPLDWQVRCFRHRLRFMLRSYM